MQQSILTTIIFGFVQMSVILLVSPLVIGIITKVKAFMQNRQGAGIFQPYRNIRKLFQKEAVISTTASWITPVMPYVLFITTLSAAIFIPLFTISNPFGGFGDALVVIYLLALGSFFLALAGLDQGSAFGGMGSSRHMTVASLAEPAMVLSIFATGVVALSTNLTTIVGQGFAYNLFVNPIYIFSFVALFIVMLAETGRVPIDNPATHLELTMIHEAMVLDYSGKYLAFIEWASAIKLTLFLTLLANLFFPFGLATVITIPALVISLILYIAKLAFFAAIIAIIESSTAKLRLFRVPDLLWMAFTLALLGIIIYSAS